MLKYLTLENFKGLNLHIDFPPGMTMITGNNYSGKTRVLYGILFAFWGVSAVPGGAKKVPTRGMPASKTKVVAGFIHDGHSYTIERKVSSAKLWRGDEPVATGLSSVTKELEEILSIPQKFFMHLKYAEQGETQALLTLGASKLHEIVDHVSGADLVNKIVSRSSKLATAAGNKIDAIGPAMDVEFLRDDEKELAAQLVDEYAAITRMQNLDASLQLTIQDRKKRYDDAVEWNDLQTGNGRALVTSRDNIATAGRRLKHLEAEAAKHYDGASANGGLAEQVRLATEERNTVRRWEESAEELREELDKIDIATADKEWGVEQEALQTMEYPEIRQTTEDRVRAEMSLSHLQQEKEKLEGSLSSSICPTCKRPYEKADVSQLDASILRLAFDIDQSTSELDDLRNNEQAIKVHRSIYETQQTKVTEAKKKVDGLVAQARSANNRLDSIEDDLQQASAMSQDEFDELAIKAAAAQRAAGAYSQIAQEYETTEQSLEELKAAAEGLPQAEKLIDAAEMSKELEQERVKQQSSSKTLLAMSTSYSGRRGEWTTLNETISRETEKAEKQAGLLKERETALGLSKYLKSNRDRFLSTLWSQITNYSGDFASSCTSGAVEGMQRTEDASFTFTEEGEVATMQEGSGAQKSIMAIGVQLALDTLLPDTFGALLLDEPTADMDAEHSYVFTQMLAQTGRQIIMVSHREMDSSVAQSHVQLS